MPPISNFLQFCIYKSTNNMHQALPFGLYEYEPIKSNEKFMFVFLCHPDVAKKLQHEIQVVYISLI